MQAVTQADAYRDKKAYSRKKLFWKKVPDLLKIGGFFYEKNNNKEIHEIFTQKILQDLCKQKKKLDKLLK